MIERRLTSHDLLTQAAKTDFTQPGNNMVNPITDFWKIGRKANLRATDDYLHPWRNGFDQGNNFAGLGDIPDINAKTNNDWL